MHRKGHPAKRVFQALRIEVNQELAVLERAIPAALDSLQVDGRIVVLAYHSLEDRIVKRALAAGSRSSAPAGLPVELPEHRPELRLLVHGAEQASEDEKAANPRSASVRLRAAERVRAARLRAVKGRVPHERRIFTGRPAVEADEVPLQPRHIEIVSSRSQRRARPRMVYAALTVAGLFAILIAQLLLSIAVSDGAYRIAALQGVQRELSRDQQTLTEQLHVLQSPQHLAANAQALGMVANTSTAFLRLADGAVLGTAVAATRAAEA